MSKRRDVGPKKERPSFAQRFFAEQPVGVNGFVMLTLPHPGSKEIHLIREWQGMNDLFRPEHCARLILPLSAQVCNELYAPEGPLHGIEDRPEVLEHQYYNRKVGEDAYEMLLGFSTGLLSPEVGETHVARQFKDSWAGFKGFRAQVSKKLYTHLRDIMTWSFEDTRMIQNDILERLNRGVTPGLVAKELDGIQGGERVLLIGDGMLRDDNPVIDMAISLGKNTKRTAVGELCIGFTNEIGRELLHVELTKGKRSKSFQKSTARTTLSEEELRSGQHNFSHVFIAALVGPEEDRFFGQIPKGAKVVLLNVAGQDIKTVRENWQERLGLKVEDLITPDQISRLCSEDLITPDQISRRYNAKMTENRNVIFAAQNACANCAYSRSLKQRPIREHIALEHEEYVGKVKEVADEVEVERTVEYLRRVVSRAANAGDEDRMSGPVLADFIDARSKLGENISPYMRGYLSSDLYNSPEHEEEARHEPPLLISKAGVAPQDIELAKEAEETDPLLPPNKLTESSAVKVTVKVSRESCCGIHWFC